MPHLLRALALSFFAILLGCLTLVSTPVFATEPHPPPTLASTGNTVVHHPDATFNTFLPTMNRAFTGYDLPDEPMLLYTAHDDNQGGFNFILTTAASSTTYPLTFDGANSSHMVFSADGNHIAYHKAPSDQLWVMSTDGRSIRQLDQSVEGRWISGAQWAPDNETLLYRSGATLDYGTLNTINVETGSPVAVATDAHLYDHATWDPKYSRLYYVARDPVRIRGVNADGTDATDIMGGFRDVPSPAILAVIPNGRILLRLYESVGASDLYLVDPDGTDLTRLTFDAEFETGVSVSPTGTKIFFSHQSSKTAYLMRTSGVIVWQHAFVCDLGSSCMRGDYQAWAPDGSEIAFTWVFEASTPNNTQYALFRVATDGTQPAPSLVTQGNNQGLASAYSPDGQSLVYVGADWDSPCLMMLDRTTAATSALIESDSLLSVSSWRPSN